MRKNEIFSARVLLFAARHEPATSILCAPIAGLRVAQTSVCGPPCRMCIPRPLRGVTGFTLQCSASFHASPDFSSGFRETLVVHQATTSCLAKKNRHPERSEGSASPKMATGKSTFFTPHIPFEMTSGTSPASCEASCAAAPSASFTATPSHVIFIKVLPEWRNWQTQQTQNLPGITPRVGSTPSSGTIYTSTCTRTRISLAYLIPASPM